MNAHTIIDKFDEASNPPLFKQPGHKLWRPVRDALMSVYDPHIEGISIYELGLIYNVDFKDRGPLTDVNIRMTLTSLMCPMAQELPAMAQSLVSFIEGVGDVKMEMVHTPQWDKDRMSVSARLASGLFFG